MQFLLILKHSPHYFPHTPYMFARAVLQNGTHNIKAIYFMAEAVYYAQNATNLAMPNDETNFSLLWQQLADTYAIPLLLCPTALSRRNINACSAFAISSLSILVELLETVDKSLVF